MLKNKSPITFRVCAKIHVHDIGTYKSFVFLTEALQIAKLLFSEVLVRQSSAPNLSGMFMIRKMSRVNEPNHVFKI